MLDTAHLNEVNIIDHKILRGMNCYSFIFGKEEASSFTGQSQSRQTFVSASSWGAVAAESCWGEEEAGAAKKPIWADQVRNERNSGTFLCHL